MTIKTLSSNQVVVMGNDNNGDFISFFSYDTLVMTIYIDTNNIGLGRGFDYSTTTNKHTNTFLSLYGYDFTVADIKKTISKNQYTINGNNFCYI